MSQPPSSGGKPAAPPPPPPDARTETRTDAPEGVRPDLPASARPTTKLPSVAPSVPASARPTTKLPSIAPVTPPPPPPAARGPGTPEGTRPTVSGVPSVPPAPPGPPGIRAPSGVGIPRPPPPPAAARPPPPPPLPSIAPLVPAVPSVAPSIAPSIAPAVPRATVASLPAVPVIPPGARPTVSGLPNVPPPPPPAATRAPEPDLAAQAAALGERCARLDQMDYFEVLQVERTVSPADIKKAFYRESRAYHPDRFFQLSDKELKERVNELYKRVTEAYYVLRDDAKRRQYTADIAGPERAQKLRFTESSEVETRAASKRQVEEQIGSNPKGRQFYQTGAADADAGRWASAERNLKMALTYEPANPRYKEKLAEVQKVLHEESRKQGDAFKIR